MHTIDVYKRQDVDGLHSYQEAVEMRRMLYDDPLLQPVLTFVSPVSYTHLDVYKRQAVYCTGRREHNTFYSIFWHQFEKVNQRNQVITVVKQRFLYRFSYCFARCKAVSYTHLNDY